MPFLKRRRATSSFACSKKEAPKTVANFVGLAEGTKEFTDERTGKKKRKTTTTA